MKLKRTAENRKEAAATQLRLGQQHPFSALRAYLPLCGGEARIYRELRESIPIIDAAIGKLVRLMGGFRVQCGDEAMDEALREFLRRVPCGYG